MMCVMHGVVSGRRIFVGVLLLEMNHRQSYGTFPGMTYRGKRTSLFLTLSSNSRT